MIVRKDISKQQAGDIGLELAGTLEGESILDHAFDALMYNGYYLRQRSTKDNITTDSAGRRTMSSCYERMSNQIQYKLIRSTTW